MIPATKSTKASRFGSALGHNVADVYHFESYTFLTKRQTNSLNFYASFLVTKAKLILKNSS